MGKMQYDLATNFDEDLMDYVIQNDKNHQIKSIFGKLKTDIAGGGRASFILPELSMEQLKNYAKKCEDAGIEFNYLLNPITLNDAEVDPGKNAKLFEFIDQLYSIGIKSFTVNSPYLCKALKTKYSDVRITVGLYAVVMTIQQIQYWISVGADEITLDHIFNRNFPLLRHALETFKNTNVKLRLIANNFCLHECTYKINHACNIASQSVSYSAPKVYMDYSLLNCSYHKVKNPSAMITSDWIRPEDVKVYEKMAEEIGTDNLTLKLVERTRSSAFLKRVVKAYLDESYEGNLLDIMNWPVRDAEKAISHKEMHVKVEAVGKGNLEAERSLHERPISYNIDSLRKYGKIMQFPKVYIDNKKLDGFIDHFVNNFDCRNMICKNNIAPEGSDYVNQCSYCDNWAKKVISRDEKEIQDWLTDVGEIIKSIESRTVYNNLVDAMPHK